MKLTMSMFATKADYDAAVAAQSGKDHEADLFLCCADGEGSQEFRVCANEAAVFAFYEEMTGRDENGTLDSITKSFSDQDYWRNEGRAFELELYCAKFYVWKVVPREVALLPSATPASGVFVPQEVWDWLMGEGPDFTPSAEQLAGSVFAPGRYWWRSELRRRIDRSKA